MSRSEVASSLALGLALAGCAPETPATTQDAGSVIVFASDFAGYESWQPSFHLDGNPDASPPDPDAGCTTPHDTTVPRELYLNGPPRAGSAGFAVGTMIVKETRPSDDPSTWTVYAMVKRDDDFNPGSGCVGWEWFELSVAGNGATPAQPQIQWRGAAPPASAYQGCTSCVSCHASSPNDCAWSLPTSDF